MSSILRRWSELRLAASMLGAAALAAACGGGSIDDNGNGAPAAQQRINHAPVISGTAPTQATVGQPYRYDIVAADADGDALRYSLALAPAGMAVDAASGRITWTPTATQVGSQNVTAVATDPGGLSASRSFAVAVAAAPNGAPQITSTAVTSAFVGVAYAYAVQASDPNGDPLTYSLTQAPAGMSINATSGVIAWVPAAAQTGSQGVTVRVADRAGLAATQNFTINVPVPNAAPQITSSPVTTATAGTPYGYAVRATDANGDTLAYSLLQAPGGMTVNAASGLISWTPAATQVGNQAVSVRVADPGGLAATQSFTIAVAPARNAAPRITSSPVTAATVGFPYAYAVGGSDPDGDALTYALTQAPSGMTINATSGLIAWTPSAAQAGAQSVTVRVADPAGLAATQAFTVTVGTSQLTMACTDGAGTQCSGETVLRTDSGVALTRSGVQASGRSTSDMLPGNSNRSTAFGLALAGGGVAEIRVRKDGNALPTGIAVLLSNLGILWDGRNNRPQIIETFNPTAGRVQLNGAGALSFGSLPPSSDLSYYDYATLGTAATKANYANNRYFPRSEPVRCSPGGWCATLETTGPVITAGSWRAGGAGATGADWISAIRNHEDGDVHAGNGLPDANGNPTWLPGGSGFGVPVAGSKGYRALEHWSYRYANLASWFTQDTVEIAEWGGVFEHNKNRRGFVAYGETSNPATVPSSGSATYAGIVRGRHSATGSDDPAAFVGTVFITVNFATRSVSVSIQNTTKADGSGSVPVALNATLTLAAGSSANAATGTGGNGTVSGGLGARLFGPLAAGGGGQAPAEIGGAISLSNAGTGSAVVGGFIARLQ